MKDIFFITIAILLILVLYKLNKIEKQVILNGKVVCVLNKFLEQKGINNVR